MQTLQAVHSKDVEQYLQSLGVLHSVKSGEIKCSICGGAISLVNFSAIYPKDGAINFVCNSFQCYEKMIKENNT